MCFIDLKSDEQDVFVKGFQRRNKLEKGDSQKKSPAKNDFSKAAV
jgi:hypothetical protein